MKDVVYLNFAQLSYFNWHKLKPEDTLTVGVSVESLIDEEETWGILLPSGLKDSHVTKDKNGIMMYQGADKRLFMKYSEEEPDKKGKMSPKYKEELSGWNFLYSANHEKIYEDYLKRGTLGEESGFNASAFKKGEENL